MLLENITGLTLVAAGKKDFFGFSQRTINPDICPLHSKAIATKQNMWLHYSPDNHSKSKVIGLPIDPGYYQENRPVWENIDYHKLEQRESAQSNKKLYAYPMCLEYVCIADIAQGQAVLKYQSRNGVTEQAVAYVLANTTSRWWGRLVLHYLLRKEMLNPIWTWCQFNRSHNCYEWWVYKTFALFA